MNCRLKKVIQWGIIGGNLTSIFFNIRWVKEYSFDQVMRLVLGSNFTLLLSTLLSILALIMLDYSLRTRLDWQSIDEELRPSYSSEWYLKVSLMISLVACSFPEVSALLVKLWLKLLT